MDVKTDEMETLLEGMIDSFSVSHVLGVIANICGQKQDHIRNNYNDEDTAAAWDNSCAVVMRAANEVNT